MREIKFRGLSYCKNEWVYGFYAQIPSDGSIGSFIFNGKEWVEIKRETLGQLTGLIDKNSKEVYEGDILSRLGDKPAPGGGWYGGTSGYHERSIVTIRKDGAAMLRDIKILSEELNFFGSREPASGYKIIGNIYSNPELVKP